MNPEKLKLHEAAARASDAAAVMEDIYSTLNAQVSKKIRTEFKTVIDAVKLVSDQICQGATSSESAYAHSRWVNEKQHQDGPTLKGERKVLGNLTNYINQVNDVDTSKSKKKRESSIAETPRSKKSRKAAIASPSSIPEAADGEKYTRSELGSIVSQATNLSQTIKSLIATGKCPLGRSALFDMHSKLSNGISVTSLGKMGRPTIATISELTSIIEVKTKDGNTLGAGDNIWPYFTKRLKC